MTSPPRGLSAQRPRLPRGNLSPRAFFMGALLACSSRARAQVGPGRPAPIAARSAARSAVYLEGVSSFFLNAAGVSYAWRPVRAFAVSLGAGVAYDGFALPSPWRVGAAALLHLLLPADVVGVWSFELATGGSVVSVMESGDTEVWPAFFLGARRQPVFGGALVRVGFAWTYGRSIGLSASFGFAW